MRWSKFILLSVFILSAASHAREVEVYKGARDFDQLAVSQLDPGSLYYNDNSNQILPLTKWAVQFPDQAAALTLYPGYQNPEVTVLIHRKPKQYLENLYIFVARAKLALNKAPGLIQVQQLLSMENISKFDPEFKPRPISADQIIGTVVARRQRIDNFQWCNPRGQSPFLRPMDEVDLSYTLPPPGSRPGWCSDPSRSVCFESCFTISDYNTNIKIDGLNLIRSVSGQEPLDHGIAFQSEIRYLGANEVTFNVPALTKINTPVLGIVEQNIFYLDQGPVYGKLLILIQEDPQDPGKTLMTSLFSAAIKEHDMNDPQKRKFFMGINPDANDADAQGIMAGLPIFFQQMTDKIGLMLEQNH